MSDPHVRYDRFELPAYDAYVYVAMADHPAFFTVPPWGYRVLTPWLVRALPIRNVARGFQVFTPLALALAAAALFGYLRRVGFHPLLALAGELAFLAAPPVAEVLRYRFLVEPLTVCLEIVWLWALEAGAPSGLLALVALCGVLSKEFFLLLLPLAWIVERRHAAMGAAALKAVAVALPAVVMSGALRAFWTPQLTSTLPAISSWSLAFARMSETAGEWFPALLLGGLTPLALAGLLRRQSRTHRLEWAFVCLVTLLPPLFNPVAFFARDVLRLLVYALPVVIVAAAAVVGPRGLAPQTPPSWPRATNVVTWSCVLLVSVVTLARVDRYRRADLRGLRDGPRVLAVCRESLRTANRLERGMEVTFNPEDRQFVWGLSDPGELDRMRWFLLEGWGALANYGTGPMVIHDARATLILPLFRPQPLSASLHLWSAASSVVNVGVNGVRIATVPVDAMGTPHEILVPAERLFRGDNELTFEPSMGGTRLLRLGVRTARPGFVEYPSDPDTPRFF